MPVHINTQISMVKRVAVSGMYISFSHNKTVKIKLSLSLLSTGEVTVSSPLWTSPRRKHQVVGVFIFYRWPTTYTVSAMDQGHVLHTLVVVRTSSHKLKMAS